MKGNKLSITTNDKQILESIKPIVDGVSRLFGDNCEVLLHSFAGLDHSIIHIANEHVTGRSIGSPITDLGMKILQESTTPETDISDCYYSETADGKTLRSVTVLIRNASKKPIGMLCINYNMSVSLIDLLKTLSYPQQEVGQAENPENFVRNIEDLIQTTLRSTINSINAQNNNIPNHEKNKRIVYLLIEKGIFDIKGAKDIVARELSVSRYTVYNYIREYKYSKKESSEL